MAKKEKARFSLPSDAGHSFDDEDFILNYRPKIEYVEPEPLDVLDTLPLKEEPTTIDTLRDRTQNLIDGYRAVEKLVDAAQARVDARAKDFKVKLDPKKDQITISAVKRFFPEKLDPTEITYDDYKKCLAKMNEGCAPEPPALSLSDVLTASNNPTKTDFGGLSNQQGQNRAEISSPASSVQPVDLEAFQAAGILALFALLRPLIKLEDSATIAAHISSAGHLGAAPVPPV